MFEPLIAYQNVVRRGAKRAREQDLSKCLADSRRASRLSNPLSIPPSSPIMTSPFRLGQILKGKLSVYTITKQLHQSIWLANNRNKETVVIKSVGHFRLENERDVLKRFQDRAPLRPLIDEIEDPSDPPTLVLKYLDDDALRASTTKKLTRPEVIYVMRNVLEALKVLHEDGYVHTDVKPDNVLVNYGHGDIRFSDVKLGDCGSTVHRGSEHAKQGHLIGAPIFRSPEAQLRLGWNTATDIWSLGTMLISLLWGENWHIFKPDVPVDHEHYDLKILMKHHQFFGPFPLSYQEIAGGDTLTVLAYAMRGVPHEMMKPFQYISEREITKEDKAFILKIMKLDPRDRPTAKDLLEDEWFQTAEPLHGTITQHQFMGRSRGNAY
ncbi:kinase-like protein [Zopfia rhizophila CBS 207.26]|uniref:Kinase-like protein n=1 Tax=Zopfia rhizophila CBS 207.26 TaxID=1314779 RepID=A0A6A6EFA5_9PEZI|nr:kinase-like protein [Zopfia rhizophila CBS 207.26]